MELEVREVTGEEKARLNNRLKAYKNEMQRFEQDLVSSQIKIHVYGLSRCTSYISFLRAPLVARNPNLQIVIMNASHVCSQHSFGLPLRLNGMHRT